MNFEGNFLLNKKGDEVKRSKRDSPATSKSNNIKTARVVYMEMEKT